MVPHRPRTRASYKQLGLLVKFMGANPHVARGVDTRTAVGRHYHDAKWIELANLLNKQENAMNKSPKEWNRYWKDLKSGIKKKVHAIKTRSKNRKITLSSIEKIIYQHMCEKRNKTCVLADAQIPDIAESDNEQNNYELSMESRRRRTRATYKQLKLLGQFMSDNPHLAQVDYRTAVDKDCHDAKWTELAELLNSQENGMIKARESGIGLINIIIHESSLQYWKELKSSIKKKVDRKVILNSIEQTICENKDEKSIAVDKTHSYLHIPSETDNEESYEVEYLEDSSCDEVQLIPKIQPVAELATNIDKSIILNDLQPEILTANVTSERLLKGDHGLIADTIFKSFNPLTETLAEETVTSDIKKNTENNSNRNLSKNYEANIDVLTDIRYQLKALVEVQKDKARSTQRLAAAHERRAVLEEKRVRIEEHRVKMEERRVALEERKIEAKEKKAFAEERLATAAERRNDLQEYKMNNET